jgi:TRAP-type C4-dicarboxylate transport system substrate-binding protein
MEQGIYISEKKYNKMTDWQKQAFNEVAEEIQNEWVPTNFTMDTQRVIELFSQAGVELYYMTDDEWNTWYEYAQQTSWKNFVETSPNGQWLLDQAIAASK